jgi:hypothetical protein
MKKKTVEGIIALIPAYFAAKYMIDSKMDGVVIAIWATAIVLGGLVAIDQIKRLFKS